MFDQKASDVASKPPGECKTCASRTYQDKSDDPSVSFQSPTHISPQASGTAVMAHEQEHVINEKSKAYFSLGKTSSPSGVPVQP